MTNNEPAFNERAVLCYDPFSGDESDVRVLKDKIVTTRRIHECHQCGETMGKGQRSRARTELYEGVVKTLRCCQTCTELMAEDQPDAFWERCQTNKRIIGADAMLEAREVRK